MRKNLLFIALLCLPGFISLKGQTDLVSIHSKFESMHTWRGFASADRPTFTGTLTINPDRHGVFYLGLWGATAVAQENSGFHYQEIDYFVSFNYNDFSIELTDMFATKGATAPNIWDYKKETTIHQVDLGISYNFQKFIPLSLSANVLIYGKDYELNEQNELKNRYSTYLQANYTLYNSDAITLNSFIGAGFALNGKTMEYGSGTKNFEIVNVGLKASRNLLIGNYTLPVHGMVFWNPATKLARFQVSIDLF